MYNPLKVSLENIIPLTEARDHFSQIVNEVQKDKLYVLTKGGKPAVAIIDVKYLEQVSGGEISKTNVESEIQKNPAKVGLPQMVKHDMPQTPPAPAMPPLPKPFEPPKPAAPTIPTPPPPMPKPTPIPPSKPIESPKPNPIPQPAPPKPAAQTPPFNAPVSSTLTPKPNIPPATTTNQPLTPKPVIPIAPVPNSNPVNSNNPNNPNQKPVIESSFNNPLTQNAPKNNAGTPIPIKTNSSTQNTIDVQPAMDDEEMKKADDATNKIDQDDKNGPAQYAGDGQDAAEPDDMPID